MKGVFMKWILVIAFSIGTAALGDEKPAPPIVDAETYRAAMERLKAKAASQPSEIERLQRENAELKQLVAHMKEDIVRLNKQLAVQAKLSKGDGKLRIGMTLDEARRAMGAQGGVDTETATEKVIRFSEFIETTLSSGFRTVFVTFEDGKITRLSYSPANMSPKPIPEAAATSPNPPKKKTPNGY
jgi:hypothetical protein